MITEPDYWKRDLLKLASRLELRLIQNRWGNKNIYTIEKEVFIGFYSIRKLIESKKISDAIRNKIYNISEFTYIGDPKSTIISLNSSDYDLSKVKRRTITVIELCNQFIHSYYFVPFLPNGRNLIGFFFCSDHKKNACIYLITLFDVVDIYRKAGND